MNYKLNYNSLRPNELSDEQFMQALKDLPKDATSLNLECNYFWQKSGTQLAQIFAAIPNSVTALNLSDNSFANCTGDKLAQAFAAIPSNVTSLDLSTNHFYKTSFDYISQALKALSNTITSLDLSYNGLGVQSGYVLSLVLEAIPSGVHFLDLKGNCLTKIPAPELAQAFNKLPANVTVIDLRHNSLHRLSMCNYFLGLLDNVKKSPFVTTIYLGKEELEEMNSQQQEILKAIFPNAKYVSEIKNNIGVLSNTEITEHSKAASSLEKVGLFANSCKKDEDGFTSFDIAFQYGHLDVLKAIEQHQKINRNIEKIDTFFFHSTDHSFQNKTKSNHDKHALRFSC